MMIEGTGKITQKGQLTIPIAIRKKLSDVYGILGRPPQNASMPVDEAILLSRKQRGEESSNEDDR